MGPKFRLLDQLYAAALSGSVCTLTELIQNDPQILHRVSLSSKPETPLHISALRGHFDFTQALLKAKPEFASRLDSLKCSPLHLASAEGHTQIVKALLRANTEVCLVADQEGRIPLHLAAMRGKAEIIKELVDAKPESIHLKLSGSSSVVHICVQYNQLDALRQLVTLPVVDKNQLLEFRDHGGSTILHLAVMLRQSETIKYLVSMPEIKANINSLNRMGLSALDLLECYPRDFKTLEIGDILIKAGSRRSDPNPPNTVPTQSAPVNFGSWLKWKIISAYNECNKHLSDNEFDWVKKMQKTLMLVATLTATISFQVAVNPPGGFLQQDYKNSTVGNYNCSDDPNGCVIGNAVLSYVRPDLYTYFTKCTIASFISSLSVVLLAISGLPLKNKLFTWLMTIAMILSITFLFFTFFVGIEMVTPDVLLFSTIEDLIITALIWFALVGIAIVFHTIRLLFFLVECLIKLKRFVWEKGSCLIRLIREKLSRPTRSQGPIFKEFI